MFPLKIAPNFFVIADATTQSGKVRTRRLPATCVATMQVEISLG
jgi:hypothetical protein